MEPACRLCKNRLDDKGIADVCGECVRSLGIVAMPPPRRPARPCTCGSRRFIRSIVLRRHEVNRKTIVATTEAITYRVVDDRVRVGVAFIGDIQHDLRQPLGLIARYICAQCGAIEERCEDPERIPIGPEYMTDVVDYGGDDPYR